MAGTDHRDINLSQRSSSACITLHRRKSNRGRESASAEVRRKNGKKGWRNAIIIVWHGLISSDYAVLINFTIFVTFT